MAAADCTGHGVPGAFVYMVCQGLLNKIVVENKETNPAAILQLAHAGILDSFTKESTRTKANDGMDIALTVWDKKTSQLHFSGAMNPCYVVRNGELMEMDANRRGIGGIAEVDYQFEGHSMQVEIGDMIYLSSDGYKDQFGGPKGKKFMTSKFKELIVAVAMQPTEKQYAILDATFSDWMGEQEQIDDVLVTGYRIT